MIFSNIFNQKPENKPYNVDGHIYHLPTIELSFVNRNKKSIKNRYGHKPLVNNDGKPMFAELALRKRMEIIGDSRWIASSRHFITKWTDKGKGLKFQEHIEFPDEACNKKLLEIEQNKEKHTLAGCWDVVTWDGLSLFFIESKHKGDDHLNKNQIKWYKAGLKSNIPKNNFLIIQWFFQ